ncbi:MAG: NfeD family protein [Thermoleophilia bacterium]
MCHLALLLPVVGLGVFFVLPLPWALVSYLVIAGATVLLYKAVIDAMRRRVVTGREALLGARVDVRRVESNRLVVCLGGELWSAQGAGFHDGGPRPGDLVVISQVRGNTLVVSPPATPASV